MRAVNAAGRRHGTVKILVGLLTGLRLRSCLEGASQSSPGQRPGTTRQTGLFGALNGHTNPNHSAMVWRVVTAQAGRAWSALSGLRYRRCASTQAVGLGRLARPFGAKDQHPRIQLKIWVKISPWAGLSRPGSGSQENGVIYGIFHKKAEGARSAEDAKLCVKYLI